MPRVQVERCELRSAMVRLFRYPGVLLTIHGGRQGAGEETRPGEPTARSVACRFVEAFSWDAAAAAFRGRHDEPNRPNVRAQQTVLPGWNGRSWTVKTDCRISVRGGVVDEIRIRAPAPWNGPYQANPPGQVRVSEIARRGAGN